MAILYILHYCLSKLVYIPHSVVNDAFSLVTLFFWCCVSSGRNLRWSSSKSHRFLYCSHTRCQWQAVQKGKFIKPADNSQLSALLSTTAWPHTAPVCSLVTFHLSGKKSHGLNQNVLKRNLCESLYCSKQADFTSSPQVDFLKLHLNCVLTVWRFDWKCPLNGTPYIL